ncbi:hypothetical protein [Micromonospora sp. SL4-19]|uniref:hypothetical protein n=1 Tax=Micromonospora sp. SL4-19 TaxID=3399129 RepID=UPI003A4D1E58
MRHAVSSVTIALSLVGAVVAPAGIALAAPAAAPVLAAAPKKKCTIEDKKLRALSGLVATKSGYVVINDGSVQDSQKRVFYLDTKCEISKEVRYSGAGPFDTQDLALGPGGSTLWIADTGDSPSSKTRRERVAVWNMPLSGSKQPVLHRLSYPENKPHDAEALLIGDDNLPLIITKDPSGKAEIFKPEAKLKSGDTEPVPMTKVGEVTIPKTNTENKLGAPGRLTVSGASRSPDGTKVVLRTYADAFEYDVAGGDIVGALTTGKPRVTPLADPFGEAISYTPDGKSFVTVSDATTLDATDPVDVLSYTPSAKGVEALPNGGKDVVKQSAADKSWLDELSLNQITYLIAAVGVIGALLVGAGIFGIMRARRKPAPSAEPADARERGDGFPQNDGSGSPHGGSRGGGVYGGAPANGTPGRPGAGGVYGGGRPQDGGGRGGVYGGGQQGGVYGGGQQGRGGQQGGGGYGGGQQGGGYGGGRSQGGVYGGAPQGGGYGAEPPRREPDRRDPRAGRRGDGGYGDREYRGDRY